MKLGDKKLNWQDGRVEMAHGSGGRAMHHLIEELFLRFFQNPYLHARNDQAFLPQTSGRMVMTTDSRVISPLFFPGGDIGSLSVHGTLNDLAMAGAIPVALSSAFIIEEGFPLHLLEKIVMSMALAAEKAGVPIITGDTKVVERGKGDGVFITTTGMGCVEDGIDISANRAKIGDCVLVNGFLGDHGIAVLRARGDLGIDCSIESDTVSLADLVQDMLKAAPGLRVLRDPTRGGLATTLHEIAQQSRVGFLLDEASLPIRKEVLGACELLGIDPLHIANEGKLIAICPENEGATLLSAMRAHPLGKDAALIGRVIDDPDFLVQMTTPFGGTRLVQWLSGDPLPRIC